MVPALEPELLGVRTGASAGGPSDSRATIWIVASVGRQDPCPCGSGQDAERCCGVPRGPSEESEAHAFLVHASRDATATLALALALAPGATGPVRRAVGPAANRHLAPGRAAEGILPRAQPPVRGRARQVRRRPLLDAVTHQLDTPLQRARLARAVIAQERWGTIGHRLAAAALVDLASSSRQLLRRSVLGAVAVRVGAVRTPGGLMVAA